MQTIPEWLEERYSWSTQGFQVANRGAAGSQCCPRCVDRLPPLDTRMSEPGQEAGSP